MTVNDFMKTVNSVAHATWNGEQIHVYTFMGADLDDWFLSLDPSQQSLDALLSWTGFNIEPQKIRVVMNAFTELLLTPIEDRSL